MCQCPTGFSGKRCERDGCDNFCQNGGKANQYILKLLPFNINNNLKLIMLYQMKPRCPCFWTFWVELSRLLLRILIVLLHFVNELLHTYSRWKELFNRLVFLTGKKTEGCDTHTIIKQNQNNVQNLLKTFDCKVLCVIFNYGLKRLNIGILRIN